MIFDGKEGEGVSNKLMHAYADLLKARTFLLRKARAFLILINVSACNKQNFSVLPDLSFRRGNGP